MSGVRQELVRSSKYEVTRRQVVVDVPSLGTDSRLTIQVFSATYAPPHDDMTEEPRMTLPLSHLSREQWEQIKQLGDEAWTRFEADHWAR